MTRHDLARQTFLMTAALSAVAVGGWFFALSGPHRRLEEAQRTLALQARDLTSAGPTLPDAPERTAAYQARIAATKSILARTPAPDALYDSIQKAAAASGIRVERLEPESTSHRSMDLSRTTGYSVEPIAFDVEARGTLAAAAGFIDRMERSVGLARITSLRVLPAPGANAKSQEIVLHVTTTHFIPTLAAGKEH
jgi:hypothetical protein